MGEAKRRIAALATANADPTLSRVEQPANDSLIRAKEELRATLRELELANPNMQILGAPLITRSAPTGQDYLDALNEMSRAMIPAPLVRFLIYPIPETGGALLCPFTLVPKP
jgi:hypothetical protein